MIGPAVAGLVIASVGTGWAFLCNGMSFMAVLTSPSLLRRSELRPNPRAHRAKGGLTEGFRYVWSRSDLRAMLIMLFLIGTFGLNFPIFISTMAVGVFHTGCARLRTAVIDDGSRHDVGRAARRQSRERPRFALAAEGRRDLRPRLHAGRAWRPNYWSFAAALVVIGVAALTVTNTSNALMQLSTEPAMRGRVMALRARRCAWWAPIGAPIVGLGRRSSGPALGARRRRGRGPCGGAGRDRRVAARQGRGPASSPAMRTRRVTGRAISTDLGGVRGLVRLHGQSRAISVEPSISSSRWSQTRHRKLAGDAALRRQFDAAITSLTLGTGHIRFAHGISEPLLLYSPQAPKRKCDASRRG